MKCLFFLLLLTLFVSAQQTRTISGIIVDAETKSPLISANISLNSSHIGSLTDHAGRFSLTSGFYQTDTIIISYLGYGKRLIPVNSFIAGELKIVTLIRILLSSQSVYITATVGEKSSNPVVMDEITKTEIQKNYSVQDVPEYLSTLPSVSYYSDNGASVGYNYLSIRGFDQRRIAVSINGIPQNDPEDHNVYWINFSDILSGTDLIAVQRGSGGGVSGYPAIGGSVNLVTSPNSEKPFTYFRSGVGSFNTRKYSVEFASGIFNQKNSLYVKLAQISSSGYRDKSYSKLNSYYVSFLQFDKKLTTQINIYGGILEDGLVYTGLPKFSVTDRNLRKKNYSYWGADETQFTYTLERRAGEIENFEQPHFEFLNEYQFSDKVTLNSALFLVTGSGFYDYDASWAPLSYFRIGNQYGFNLTVDPDTIYSPNALIRAMVENIQYGWIPRISIKHDNGEFIAGTEIRRHSSLHWGSLNYGDNLPEGIPQEWKYYGYKGSKDILNFFIFENFKLTNNLNIQGELQAAYNRYRLSDEKFVGNDFTINNFFLNGRIGIHYNYSDMVSMYVTAARVNREPRLKEYYDAAESSGGAIPQFGLLNDGSYNWQAPFVQPETMSAFDFGVNYSSGMMNAGINLYAMFFTDEIVKNGDLDRFGQPRTGNMNATKHLGFESTFSIKVLENFSFLGNFSISSDKITEGYRFVDLSGGVRKIDLSGNTIAGFPAYLSNIVLQYSTTDIFVQANGKFSGKLYSDNYGDGFVDLKNLHTGLTSYYSNVNDSFFTLGFFASYSFSLFEEARKSKFYIQINNVLDKLYSAYAIGGEFYPAAERNFFFGIEVGM